MAEGTKAKCSPTLSLGLDLTEKMSAGRHQFLLYQVILPILANF